MWVALTLSISLTSYSDQYRCPPTKTTYISTFDCDNVITFPPSFLPIKWIRTCWCWWILYYNVRSKKTMYPPELWAVRSVMLVLVELLAVSAVAACCSISSAKLTTKQSISQPTLHMKCEVESVWNMKYKYLGFGLRVLIILPLKPACPAQEFTI